MLSQEDRSRVLAGLQGREIVRTITEDFDAWRRLINNVWSDRETIELDFDPEDLHLVEQWAKRSKTNATMASTWAFKVRDVIYEIVRDPDDPRVEDYCEAVSDIEDIGDYWGR